MHLKLVNNRACNTDHVHSEILIRSLQNKPCTMFLTVTKEKCKFINDVITQHLFQNEMPLCQNIVTSDEEEISIYKRMNILITENINKMHNLVNGAEATIVDFKDNIIFITLKDNTRHFLILTYSESLNSYYYPFIPNYCSTIFKCQGKNLLNITVRFDSKCHSPGAAYVAFSRVSKFSDINLLQKVNRIQLCPIKYLIKNGEQPSTSHTC